jgi:hypothetical protein
MRLRISSLDLERKRTQGIDENQQTSRMSWVDSDCWMSGAIQRRGPASQEQTMATRRRTTMRSRSGTKLYAVRDEGGKFKDIQTYKGAHAADLRHKSKAEKEAAQGPIEKQLRKTANDSVKSIKSSVRGAVAAVQRAAKRAVKRVSSSRPEANKTVNSAVKTTTNRPGATRAVKKAVKKPRGRRLRKEPAKGG